MSQYHNLRIYYDTHEIGQLSLEKPPLIAASDENESTLEIEKAALFVEEPT